MAQYGVGASLASLGQGQMQEATKVLAESASQESQRVQQNKVLAQQEKAGKQQLAGTLGATAGGAIAGAEFGAAAGPWGALIGGVVGAVAGGFL